MAQQPAVVIIARHGPRLDAADQSWHLSTPTPYDPPLTYGGWNQSRALGVRIASLLHAREQSANDAASEPSKSDGVTAFDFAQQDGDSRVKDGGSSRKRKRKHKVVMHTSPFLRCVQTSVAIAAGMAQFQAPPEPGSRPSTSSKSRTPSSMHSASPRLRGLEGLGSPTLAPIAEPKHDLAHAIARRVMSEHKRHRKSKLRVDAFLGEWLNPQYFDQITPPPPSAMMVATAKAELMQNETVDIFTPTISSKASNSSLWGGSGPRVPSRESTLDDWSDVQDALPPSPRRDRAGSVSSIGSNDSGSGRRSPFRPGHVLQPFTSTVPKPETSVYVAPTPHYAVSSSDVIPRGYVSHARQACVNVDYQWDSSRPPQDWGDGGEYGEEWSAMHKRFRRGLNHLVDWYSQHDADDRAEDSLSLDQAEKHVDEEEEDLVLILVTHGAGSNALIGALTGQPVLLDVGMASLTMAVRRDDAPHIPLSAANGIGSTDGAAANGHGRRWSLDMGLPSLYEMKLISSSEHLRPGADPTKASSATSAGASNPRSGFSGTSSSSSSRSPFVEPRWNLNEPIRSRSSTSSALGSVRRPPTLTANSHHSGLPLAPPEPGSLARSNTTPAGVPQVSHDGPTGLPLSPGLWTPPASRTPLLQAQEKVQEERARIFSSLSDASGGRVSPGSEMVLDFSNSPPDSRPGSSGGLATKAGSIDASSDPASIPAPMAMAMALNGGRGLDGAADDEVPELHSLPSRQGQDHQGSISDLASVGPKPPQDLGRTLSQKGLWGTKPGGDKVARKGRGEPKRRWTVDKRDG